MKIAFLNQFFWPDTAATAQLVADVCRTIGSEHVRVTAICGGSNYGVHDMTAQPPARILRTSAVSFSRTPLHRLLSYGTFIAGAVWNSYRIERPDVIVTMTTPPLLSVLGRMIKLMRGCQHYIWEMDVYPDIAVDLDVLGRNSMLATVIGFFADWSRRHADGIIAIGDDMKSRLIARGIPEDRIFVAENWADGSEITPRPFPEGPFVVHYSGNFGLAHDVDTIAGAMHRLRNDSRFHFVFAGTGVRREYLKNYCAEQGIENVTFRPYCTRPELGASLAEGHVGLVTQLPQTSGSVVPSKIYGIMAAGRPLLYIGPPDSTPAQKIERYDCGWRVEPGDIDGLVHLLHRLQTDRESVCKAGQRGREAFEQHHDLPIAVQRIINFLGLSQPDAITYPVGHDSVPALAVSDANR
ncbi:MAG TPA: glycosyltransferase family 4 protein [Terracidiphilus sp.]|nr:glycosyltransferase family 4 protein [Terracidiphilus sp.]